MTFSVTIPVWAIDGFMIVGCISVALSIMSKALDIALLRLKSKSQK